MENFLDLTTKRQSCRNFASTPLEHEKVVNCIEAARLSPSACNSQPWGFVVVESPELVAEVAKCTQQMGINAYTSGAKAFIVVLEEYALLMPKIRCLLDSQYFAKSDIGGAISTICYAAQEQGIGTCILGLFDRERLSELLKLPKEQRYAVVIALGYPADEAVRAKIRKTHEQIAKYM